MRLAAFRSLGFLALGAVFSLALLATPSPLSIAPPAIAGADSVLTSHWEDAAQREVFVIAGDHYQLRVATHPARILSQRSDGRELLGPGGATPWIESTAGTRLIPAPRELVPVWDVHTGQKSLPAKSSAARMNIWRATPNYWEIHLRDIPFLAADAPPGAAPLRAHLVFHAHPNRLHLEFRSEPAAGQAASVRLGWAFDTAATSRIEQADKRAALAFSDSAALLAPPAGGFEADPRAATTILACAPAAAPWFVLRAASPRTPPAAPAELSTLFREELAPLATAAFAADAHGVWSGYDPASGLYLLDLLSNRPAFSFDAAHKVPSRRIETAITAPASSTARTLTVLARTGLGNLEAGVLAGPHGFPRAVPAFVAKNFAGEKEEPDDTAYGDILFPLSLGPTEPREHRVLALFQTWGEHMLKQVSSIRFFNIYWHLSTGLSETTCFTHAWMFIRGGLVSIPDFRPYSGPFMMGQPQHDCYSWPGFLNYETAAGPVRPLYERTDFHAIAPNLSRFTMRFRTSDAAARLAVEILEIPQTDEMRTFLRLRYDWDKPVALTGDTRRTFRWLQTYEKNLPRELLWLPAEGRGRTLAVPKTTTADAPPLLLAEPLATAGPYAGAHEQKDNYSSLMLITRIAGRLGGQPVERAFLTAEFDATKGLYAFVSERADLKIDAGDWLEADVLLMPHAEINPPLFKATREREYWFERAPRITAVGVGTKRADFPATVRADNDVARFTVTGGLDTLPLVAEGFSAPGVPLLWKDALWQDQQLHGGDGYQVDRDPADGTHRFTFVYPIRRTESHDFTVSLLKVRGAEVAGLRDDNGLPVARFTARADYTVTSPVFFQGGENRITAGSDLVRASGRTTELRAVPVSFTPATGEAVVRIAAASEARVDLTIEGAAGRLSIGHRAPGRRYEITREGHPGKDTLLATDQDLILDLPATPTPRRISITPAAP
jgi:hypothetical protein